MTMKLTATMMVSVDGVYQGPGGPDEDRRGGFDRGGWARAPASDEELARFLDEMLERADGLLLGRKTWQIFEGYWPHHHDESDPVSHGINVLPKYVPSTTLRDPGWNTHVIAGDVETAIRDLKAKAGGELQVHGSGGLLRWLLERDLVDELNLRIYPVVVGDGERLFPEQGQTHNLELVDSRTTSSGVTLQTYRPNGRATFGNAG
jgi:dihydrofolate reductase